MRDHIGTFHETTKNRGWSTEMLDNVAVKNRVYGLIEFDVTRAREYIGSHKEKTGETLSLTGWMIKCIAQAVSEDRQMQAYKKGRNKFVIFDDVDVSIVVERDVGGGQTLPLPYVVRKANEKSFRQISDEIRAAQAQKLTGVVLGNEELPRFLTVFKSLPGFLRKIGWWKFRNDPFLKKRIMGTIGVTSIGMFGKTGGWPINIGFHSLEFALGGTAVKPTVIDDKTENREYLSVTVMFDHDVVDGAPAARFTTRLAQLVKEGFGLVE